MLGASAPNVVNGTNFLVTGNYTMESVNINSDNKPMIVTGNATLWVTGDFKVSGTVPHAGYIYIAPGASLVLYVGRVSGDTTTTTSISGGGVVNDTGLPANFSYYGLPTNKTMTYSGS